MTQNSQPIGYLPKKTPSPWWNIAYAVFYYLVYQGINLVVSLVYTIWQGVLLPSGITEEEASRLLDEAIYRDGNLLMIVIDALVFLSLAIFFLARGRKLSLSMGMKKPRISALPLAFAAGLGLNCALTLAMTYVESAFPGIMGEYDQAVDMTYNTQDIILYAIAGVIGAPLIEELVCRHLVTGKLSKTMPRLLAVFIGSAVFGLMHSIPFQQVYATVLGCVLAFAYFAYDSVWVSIAMHAGFNALSLLSVVDTESMTEVQQNTFGLYLMLSYVVLSLVGVIATVFLFIRHTHPVLRNPKRERESAQMIPVYAPGTYNGTQTTPGASAPSVYRPAPPNRAYPVGEFPTVADFSRSKAVEPSPAVSAKTEPAAAEVSAPEMAPPVAEATEQPEAPSIPAVMPVTEEGEK